MAFAVGSLSQSRVHRMSQPVNGTADSRQVLDVSLTSKRDLFTLDMVG